MNTKAHLIKPLSSMHTDARRIEDQEILFTTLLLWLGPPPRSQQVDWQRPRSLEGFGDHVVDYSEWALKAKDHMAYLGHNPHQGLFTEFAHWYETQWSTQVQLG